MEKNKLSAKTSSIALIASFFTSIIAIFVFSLFLMSIFQVMGLQMSDYENFTNSSLGQLLSSVISFSAIFVIFLHLNKNKDNKIINKPSIKKMFLYILLACAVFFLLNPITSCLNTLFVNLGFKPAEISYKLTTTNYLLSIILLVIFPAVVEELLFRGLIFKGLKQHGKVFACVITSIMFSIYHMSIYQAVYPLLFGLFLSVIMFYENNILYCILAHATNNFLSLTLMFLNVNLTFDHWTFILIAIILLILFLTIVIITLRANKTTKETKELDTNDKTWLYNSLGFMSLVWLITTILSLIL